MGRLDAAVIRATAGPAARGLQGLDIVEETGSTNADLLALPRGQLHRRLLLAERQTAGRGRRGRRWQSPPGNICLSLGWRFEAPPAGLAFLPLVVAVAVARALDRAGLQGHGVKWPNDVLVDGAKLAGCLVELRGAGPTEAVVGVGLNSGRIPADGAGLIDQPYTSLADHAPGVTRDRMAGLLVGALFEGLETYAAGLSGVGTPDGFDPFRADWARWDLLEGREIRLTDPSGDRPRAGIARGPGPRGGLLLECDGAREEVLSGDVSVRLADRA